jgi:uncharacterized protein YecT (DUF1311 family)
MKTMLLALLVVMAPTLSLAEENFPCLTGTPADQLKCVQGSFEESEVDLNQTYGIVMKSIKNDKVLTTHVREAQKAWIYLRAGDCELRSFSRLSTMHLVAAQANCSDKMNRERTATLKAILTPLPMENKEIIACYNKANEERAQCLQDSFEDSEVQLNQMYQHILELLENKQEYGNEKNFVFENMSSRLKIAQRSWLYFRATECNRLTYELIDSTPVVSAQISCTTKMNIERAASLKTLFSRYLNKGI